MTLKVCKLLYEKGEWSKKICEANCDRGRQVKCSFLMDRIIEEANNPDRERDIDENALQLRTSKKG